MTNPITTPAQMREAAALLATSFLVGDPKNGVPLRNPMAHEIAAAIRSLPVAEQQAIRDKALEDAALECDRLSSEQRMYLFSDPGMFGGQWIRVAGLCATAIRAMKGKPE